MLETLQLEEQEKYQVLQFKKSWKGRTVSFNSFFAVCAGFGDSAVAALLM